MRLRPPALADRSFCMYITTTGRVDGLVGLVYRRSAWQNWLALFIHTNDARRYTLRLRFLISCVDPSPKPERAQTIGCLGTASALLCFWSDLHPLCSVHMNRSIIKHTYKVAAWPALRAAWPSVRPAGQRRTGLAGWLRRPGWFPWSAQVPEILPKNPKLDRLQKFPNSVEMILRCIRWHPQRIKPQKLWKWCRSEYPCREVGFSQEILPRVKNRAHDESAWFTWQGVHLMSFHELNPTQQPKTSRTQDRAKWWIGGRKKGKTKYKSS